MIILILKLKIESVKKYWETMRGKLFMEYHLIFDFKMDSSVGNTDPGTRKSPIFLSVEILMNNSEIV